MKKELHYLEIGYAHFSAGKAMGFEINIEKKNKKNESSLDSAFIKANTLIHLLKINVNLKTQKNAKLKIKIEIDKNQAIGFQRKVKYH